MKIKHPSIPLSGMDGCFLYKEFDQQTDDDKISTLEMIEASLTDALSSFSLMRE